MSLFTSRHTALVHRSEYEIDISLVQGFSGEQLVRVEVVRRIVQPMLALTLYLMAASFAWDVIVACREHRTGTG